LLDAGNSSAQQDQEHRFRSQLREIQVLEMRWAQRELHCTASGRGFRQCHAGVRIVQLVVNQPQPALHPTRPSSGAIMSLALLARPLTTLRACLFPRTFASSAMTALRLPQFTKTRKLKNVAPKMEKGALKRTMERVGRCLGLGRRD
jgi:hypothetical protein